MAELEYTHIIVEKKPPIGYITINRPERRNALSMVKGETGDQLSQAFEEMREDPDIRVFILKGTGACFCSGFDMSRYDESYWVETENELANGREQEPWLHITGNRQNPEAGRLTSDTLWWKELWENPKPSIAQVHSFCLGAGLWMINQCDIVYATPDAVFAYPPIRYGASVVMNILPPWLLGRRKAMLMALTGKTITAQAAYDCGLITEVVPRDKIDEVVRKTAESIARVPPTTNMFSKMAMNHYYENLSIKEAAHFATLLCLVTENCTLPGHYLDFFKLVREKGFTEGYKLQRAKWGYPDEVLEGEVARLRAEREAGEEKA